MWLPEKYDELFAKTCKIQGAIIDGVLPRNIDLRDGLEGWNIMIRSVHRKFLKVSKTHDYSGWNHDNLTLVKCYTLQNHYWF